MLYQIKIFGPDPFDMMCGDCPTHEIWWWENTTLDELHSIHNDELATDAALPEWEAQEMQKLGAWNPTTPDFDVWLKESIAIGFVREVA